MGAPKLKPLKVQRMEIRAGDLGKVDSDVLGLTEGQLPAQIMNLATSRGFHHVCQKDGHEFDKESQSARAMIEDSSRFFDFPVSTILHPGDIGITAEQQFMRINHRFHSSTEKTEILESISKYLQSQKVPQTMIADIGSVTDELFTNAVFNAPFVDSITHKNPGISRHTSQVQLGEGKSGRIFLAHDQTRLVLGCEDPYGSLDAKRYLSKIESTYIRGTAESINYGAGGAGIGSFIIFNTGSSLFMGVSKGKSTVICCVLPLGMSGRKRTQLPKHLHWIQK